MNILRDIVRRYIEDETLRDYYGPNYDTTPEQEKNRVLDVLRRRGEIDREINVVLDAFLDEIERDSPKKKRRKHWRIASVGINLGLTTLIGYAVNITNWNIVIGVSILSIMINTVFIIFGDD